MRSYIGPIILLAAALILPGAAGGQTWVEVGCSDGTDPFQVRILVRLDDRATFCEPGGVEASFFVAWTDPFPGVGGGFNVRGVQIPPCQPFNICPWSIHAGESMIVQQGSILPACPPLSDSVGAHIHHWFNQVTVEKGGAGISAPCDAADFPTEYCGDGILQFGEQCDDANTVAGDCCSASCELEPAGTACGINDGCTLPDLCDGQGICNPGEPVICDDGNACNGQEFCDSTLGCQPGIPLSCDDGLFCNGAETCNPEAGCESGARPACSDPDGCTIDFCDTALDDCVHIDVPGCSLTLPDLPCNGMDCGESEPERCLYRYCDAERNECAEFDCSAEGDVPCNGDPCLSEDPCVFAYCDPIADECKSRLIESCIPTLPPLESPIPLLLPPPSVPIAAPGGQPITLLFTSSAGPGALVSGFSAIPRSIALPAGSKEVGDRLQPMAASDNGDLARLLVTSSAAFWYLAFEGPIEFPIDLIFQYDEASLLPGTPEGHLEIFAWNGVTWRLLGGEVDPVNHTITVTVDELSLFVLGSSRLFDDDFESGDISRWQGLGPQL